VFTWLKRVVLGVSAAEFFQLPESIGTRKSGEFADMLDDLLSEERREKAVREKYDPQQARERRKDELKQELEDAKWILEYERELTALQEEIAEEIDRAREVDRSPERLQNLDRHLAHLRAGMRVK
jgi:predicted RNase H-like nuclease (RuvC/YqgF family)